MSKQVEIELGIRDAIRQAVHLHTENFGGTAVQFADCNIDEAVANVRNYLHSQDVVIKVPGRLTGTGCEICDADNGIARYLVEPLIEEEK